MADKQTQALKRLTKKLSALRQTLRADERSLLDRMILGDEAAAEVQAHRLIRKADRVAKADVEAHRLIRKADRVARVAALAEVKAHRLDAAATAAAAVNAVVIFDAATGNYVIAAEEPEVEGHLLKEAVNRKVTQVTAKAAQ